MADDRPFHEEIAAELRGIADNLEAGDPDWSLPTAANALEKLIERIGRWDGERELSGHTLHTLAQEEGLEYRTLANWRDEGLIGGEKGKALPEREVAVVRALVCARELVSLDALHRVAEALREGDGPHVIDLGGPELRVPALSTYGYEPEAAKPQFCVFEQAWISGRCGDKAVEGSDPPVCEGHSRERCWCGAQAVRQCSTAGSFVCGAPLCAEHECRITGSGMTGTLPHSTKGKEQYEAWKAEQDQREEA